MTTRTVKENQIIIEHEMWYPDLCDGCIGGRHCEGEYSCNVFPEEFEEMKKKKLGLVFRPAICKEKIKKRLQVTYTFE